MIAMKELLIIFGVSFGNANRVIRSPDKMEIDIPSYSYDRESGEYQEDINQEAVYWQEQGDKLGTKEEEGQQHLEDNRDKNQEFCDNEKEHQTQEQQNFNKEINSTYQNDRDKAEAHHEANAEHYIQYHNDTNYDMSNANKTNDLTETEIGDRYEEKGAEYAEEDQDKIENHDVNGDSPSISYTKT